jgi:hypothetical protein
MLASMRRLRAGQRRRIGVYPPRPRAVTRIGIMGWAGPAAGGISDRAAIGARAAVRIVERRMSLPMASACPIQGILKPRKSSFEAMCRVSPPTLLAEKRIHDECV